MWLLTGHGGGWGYSGHSIEAVRFMSDTDILLGGFGLFGGRGEYYGRIKVCKPSALMFEKNMLNCIFFNLNFEIKSRWSKGIYEMLKKCSMFSSCLTWALMVGIMKEMESWLGRQMKWHLNVEPGTFCSSLKMFSKCLFYLQSVPSILLGSLN